MPRQPDVRTTTSTTPEWCADDLEMECMSEDDFELDDVLADDEDLIEDELEPGPGGNVPVWRLIEMSRENRFLKQELADFEDYDSGYDDYGSNYAH